jgi:very-short-patch-repair endonuclease
VRAPILTFKRARSLRRNLTLPEVILWQAIRSGRLKGLTFRRQHPVGPYILDFFCARAHLAIEVDGAIHGDSDRSRHDERRDHWLAKREIRVLRIPASEILKKENLAGILSLIAEGAAPSTASRSPSPAARGRICNNS